MSEPVVDATTGITIGSILAAIGAGIWRHLSLQRAKPAVASEGDAAVLPSIAVYPLEYGRRLYDYKAAFDAHVLLMAQFRKDYEEHVRTVEPLYADYIVRGEKVASLERNGERDRANEARDSAASTQALDKVELRLERRIGELRRSIEFLEQQARAK